MFRRPSVSLMKASFTSLVLAACLAAVPEAAAQAQAPPAPAPAGPPRGEAPAPVVSAGANGFEIRSADSAFRVRFRGYIHADSRFYANDEEARGADTFALRRARPIFEATVFRIFDFRIMPDFGGGTAIVQDAYVEARFSKYANVRFGKQKPPVGYERLVSATELTFIERALPTALVPNRDVGVHVYGDLAPWLTYHAGLFNGVIDGGSGDLDTTDSKDFVGRLFFQPFRGTKHERLQSLAFGVATTSGKEVGTAAAPALASYRSGGQLVFFRYRSDGTLPNTTIADGQRTRLSTHGAYYLGRAGAFGEYVVAKQAVRRGTSTTSLSNQSWQLTGVFVLSGENATARGVTPRAVFDWSKRTWGAFELTARVNALTIDDDAFPVYASLDASASRAEAIGVGLNWYLNRNVKITTDYEQTRFTRGALGGADRGDEHALFSRFQIAF